MGSVIGWLKKILDTIDGDERFLMTLGAGMVNTALLLLGAIDPTTYRDLTIGTVAAFITGSSITTAVEIKQQAQVDIAEAGQP